VEDKLPLLMGRMYPTLTFKSLSAYNAADPCDPLTVDNQATVIVETCPVWEPKKDSYTYKEQILDVDGLPTLSFYDRLDMLLKPLLSAFEAELTTWKNEEKVKIAFKLSVNSLDRLRRRMAKCGYSVPNIALFKKNILEQNDTIKRDCLASHTAALDLEDTAAATRVQIAKDMAFAKTLEIDFILLIRSGTKDVAKNKRLLTKLSTVKSLLGVGDILGARDELVLVQVDADFSQGAKDLILGKLNAYLAL